MIPMRRATTLIASTVAATIALVGVTLSPLGQPAPASAALPLGLGDGLSIGGTTGTDAVSLDAAGIGVGVGPDGLDLGLDALGNSVDLGAGPDQGLSLAASIDTASFPVSLALSALLPETSPPGANDFSCVPSAEHPDPVVLVHGTFENAFDNWVQLSSDLAADGYCVYALNYGGLPGVAVKGVGDIPTSAGQLSTFVDGVLTATGAAKVDLVGHSQGGMMPRYYLQELGGAAKVDQLVGLSSSNYGTSVNGVLPLIAALPGGEPLTSIPCAACVQQRAGSDFLTALNADGDTVPGVEYTVISTVYDEVVTPYTNTFLRDPGVTNITLQDDCALDTTDHLGIPYDPIASQLVRNALDPSTAVAPTCQVVLPLVS
jgi:pimeloyl-ACP methyl ester carboxylesterase